MAFDVVLGDNFTTEKLCQNLQKTSGLKECKPIFKPLNKDIYDLEYVWSNLEGFLSFEHEFLISQLNKSEKINDRDYKFLSRFCNDHIKVNVTFDKCGIGSVRFDFKVESNINTNDLIELFIKSSHFTDDILFSIIFDDLKKTDIKFGLLKDHMLYTIISIVNDNPIRYPKKEIFGIAWKYEDYEKVNEEIINQICSNNIPLQEFEILLVTKLSTFMIFVDVDEDYVEDRIIAIEMFWRQKTLLKKLDYQITSLFTRISDPKTKNNLDLLIKKIKESQISMHSDLEAYRNSILSVTDTFSDLLKILNDVFEVNTHYNFVESKLKACDDIYQGLHDEKRNKLMVNIQWIVVVLGALNIIFLLITNDVIVSGLNSSNIQFITILLSIIVFIFIIF